MKSPVEVLLAGAPLRAVSVQSGARYYPLALSPTHTIAYLADTDTIAARRRAEAPQYRPRVDVG